MVSLLEQRIGCRAFAQRLSVRLGLATLADRRRLLNRQTLVRSSLFLVWRSKCRSAEDRILYKLMYFGLSQHSKHSRDIAAILKSKKNDLDMNYIEQWAAQLGLSSLWKEMLDNIS
jgi:hypothetical protein